ncbi:hypothetical protein MNBD_NITROSPINAE02-1672 [hydrothermal vent metagenome]|uniref:N-acetyltransferase domain-containing protein n=1 Tax=hydrothermal vent metagenome TaxID=652676 RepID=A0A3B1C478_9ZZZZ
MSKSETTLRPATLEDLNDILSIDSALFPPDISYDAETFLFYLIDKATVIFIAEVEGDVAGFVIFRPNSSTEGGLVTIDVLPRFERRGIGGALLERVERTAREAGYSHIVLQTDVANENAIRFYEKHGYKTGNRLRKYYRDNADAWEMTKTL